MSDAFGFPQSDDAGHPMDEMRLADAERAAEEFTDLRLMSPRFQPARETNGRWYTIESSGETVQDARDSLASHFLKRVHVMEKDPKRHKIFEDVAALLEWEKHDELHVLGHRYRIVRIERYVRFSPSGSPEGPWPTDDRDIPIPARLVEDNVADGREAGVDLVVDNSIHDIVKPTIDLRIRLDSIVPAQEDEKEDALVRRQAYPGLRLLPPHYQWLIRPEDKSSDWALWSYTETSPQRCREALRTHFGYRAHPKHDIEGDLPEEERTAFRDALERYAGSKLKNFATAYRRQYRMLRITRAVRFGFDGPEMPRDSDPDPYPPPAVHHEEDREKGLLGPDDDAEPSPRPTEATRRMFVPGGH